MSPADESNKKRDAQVRAANAAFLALLDDPAMTKPAADEVGAYLLAKLRNRPRTEEAVPTQKESTP